MFAKPFKLMLVNVILLSSVAFAEPAVRLEQWRRAIAIEQGLLSISQKNIEFKKAGEKEYSYEKMRLEVFALLSSEVDPNVLASIAHSSLFLIGEGSIDDDIFNNVKMDASFDISIARIEEIGTHEAFDTLERFRGTEKLQGSQIILVEETIRRLKTKLK